MEQLIAAVYDAALDPGLWPGVVRAIGASICASGVHLFAAPSPTEPPVRLAEQGFDPEHRATYDVHSFTMDPWRAAGAESRPVGVVEPSQAMVPVEVLRRYRVLGGLAAAPGAGATASAPSWSVRRRAASPS